MHNRETRRTNEELLAYFITRTCQGSVRQLSGEEYVEAVVFHLSFAGGLALFRCKTAIHRRACAPPLRIRVAVDNSGMRTDP